MERNINIAEILKSKSKGTKLYSVVFGQMTYEALGYGGQKIWLLTKDDIYKIYFSDGKYREGGEVTLYPSKEMRDWSKFAWKKGDVLISNDYSTEVIFYDWYDDTYTNFYGKHRLNSENKNNIKYNDAFLCTTDRYSLEDKDAAQTYINTIEERLGGKLNHKTLEIEKQPEFKDGDILYAEKDRSHTDAIFILETVKEKRGYYACLVLHPYMVYKDSCGGIGNKTLRYATEKEKQQLFDALAKKGKAWNAKKKQVVDLKPKWAPKPFDKVMTRVDRNAIWSANIFSHIDQNGEYVTIGCIAGYPYCLPYNEETAHLLGTTDEWKGSEQ